MTDRSVFLLFLILGAFPLFEGTAPHRPLPLQPTPRTVHTADSPSPDVPQLTVDPPKDRRNGCRGRGAGCRSRRPGRTEQDRDHARDRWTSFLTVRVIAEPPSGATDPPPLLGSYQVDDQVIRFVPRFPLEPGLRYRAEVNLIHLDEIAKRQVDPAQPVADPGLRPISPHRSAPRIPRRR